MKPLAQRRKTNMKAYSGLNGISRIQLEYLQQLLFDLP